MKNREWQIQLFVFGAVAILFISSLPFVVADNSNTVNDEVNEKKIVKAGGTTLYTNCMVFVSGKCNSVSGPLVWILGVYCPLLKRTFTIHARGQQSEALDVFILGTKPFQVGTFFDYENIYIRITRGNGLLYWGQKSIVSKSNSLFAFCKADSVLITT